MTHGADTSFLVAVEVIEHAEHADALRVLNDLLEKAIVWRLRRRCLLNLCTW